MNNKTIDGHIIDKSLLTKGGKILDAGCRNFGLCNSLGPDYYYVCMEPDKSIYVPPLIAGFNITLLNQALMHYTGDINYSGWSTGEGNICHQGEAPHYADKHYPVPCVQLQDLFAIYGQFDLVKLDIEGSEYDVLISITQPVAKQIAVEFHDCLGYNKHGSHQHYIKKLMLSEFGKLYTIAASYEYKDIPGMYEYLFKLK